MLEASRLDAHGLRKSEDCFVDQLFEGVVDIGAPLIAALFPRAYLDVNREPYELDPELFHGPMPAYANTRSIRVAGGLGTIARVVSESMKSTLTGCRWVSVWSALSGFTCRFTKRWSNCLLIQGTVSASPL